LIFFLHHRFQTKGIDGNEEAIGGCSLAFRSLKQMANPRQALISVLVFYSGVYQGFFDADFTKAINTLCPKIPCPPR
jgi:hypothetical protein